jgi:hypothetical protein
LKEEDMMKSTAKTIACMSAAFLLGSMLTACGGSQSATESAVSREATQAAASTEGEALAHGIAASTLQADFGVPQSAENVAAMAKTVGAFFSRNGAQQAVAQAASAKAAASPRPAPYSRPVFRFLNTRAGVHFYTISEAERDSILANIPWFRLEGVGFYAQQRTVSGLSPVYRFYNRISGTHFYTSSETEKDKVLANLSAIYQLDGPGLWASATAAPGWVAVHRFFNRANGTHFYTASETERQGVLANNPTMQYDGIGYYVRSNDDPGLTGVVAVNGPVQNAVVCLDQNLNDACDAGEFTSAKTGADGVYSIAFLRSQLTEAAQQATPLIAQMVPGPINDPSTTIDLADGQQVTETAYLMRQVPGKTGPINPLTTLVAAGVEAGMTESVARGNVAIQLAIAESKIDNYQDDVPHAASALVDSARLMALFTADALESGIALEVGDQYAEVNPSQGDLRSLTYTSTGNLSYLDFSYLAKAAGTPGIELYDVRYRFVGGVDTPHDLYNQAYLTPAGWLRCDYLVPLQATRGVPTRSTFCNVSKSVGYRTLQNIEGRAMGAVVTELQSDPLNFISPGANLVADLGSAVFPTDSRISVRTGVTLSQPIYINSINTDGRPQEEATTLEQLIAAKPAAGVNLPSGSGSLGLGLGTGEFKNQRVAFTGVTTPTSGTVQFYECDLDATLDIISNCVTTTTGTYAIQTLHGARAMSFAGNPETIMNNTRLYVEVKAGNQANSVIGGGDWVFYARQMKPDVKSNLSVVKRLDGTAWWSMKGQLGLQ